MLRTCAAPVAPSPCLRSDGVYEGEDDGAVHLSSVCVDVFEVMPERMHVRIAQSLRYYPVAGPAKIGEAVVQIAEVEEAVVVVAEGDGGGHFAGS